MLLNMILVLSLLLIVSVAESKRIGAIGFKKAEGTPTCETVYSVVSGDTCSGIQQEFNLTEQFFDAINPNLNCDALFVAQWICVDGTVN
ncbi:LysM domain [Dillenia turbinata]|uniref:LysM domain n=1 Tax=Dillenia turbinata TaxID=194707 RepID=A0AAN8VEB2_9MAGN